MLLSFQGVVCHLEQVSDDSRSDPLFLESCPVRVSEFWASVGVFHHRGFKV